MDAEYRKLEGIAEDECILEPLGPEHQSMANDQWTWIENELNTSTASFIVVAGHYPVYSIAEHGPTQCLVDQLKPLLIEYNVTLFMSGHDHTFEYIEEDEYSIGYIDTGGSHECNPSTVHLSDIPANSLKFHGCNDGGFTQVHVDENGLYVNYYFGNDTNIQFTTPIFKPRM